MKYYRLPTGEDTADREQYFTAWKELGKCVCDELGEGWRLGAYDPDLLFHHSDAKSIQMSPLVALVIQRLVQALSD